ncbi:hypothetical protein WJX77_008437 [Trebouxia sp. C0004]
MSDSLVLKIPELRRLYQALDWLQPPSSAPAQQQKVWSSLQGKLHRLGPRPVLNNPNISDNMLESQDNQAEATMLRLFTADHIKNIPGRLTGHAVFNIHMLAKLAGGCSARDVWQRPLASRAARKAVSYNPLYSLGSEATNAHLRASDHGKKTIRT